MTKRRVIVGAVLLVVVLGAFVGFHALRAASAAGRGKNALLAAERDLDAGNVDVARRDLDVAVSEFGRVKKEMRALGPLGVVGRQIPLVRVQLRGVDAFADAGTTLAQAGERLLEAANTIEHPPNQHIPVSQALTELRGVRDALRDGIRSIDAAATRIDTLSHERLLGPLDGARRQLVARLPAIRDRAHSAADGLDAFLVFAGDQGSRRYLLFSQNPDEIRPTGGFIGSYGVLGATNGELKLERYASIESWYLARPDAVVPPQQAPSPFRFPDEPIAQTLANVNAVADWPTAASVANDLWAKGGEQPVDGVIGYTPEFLARLVRVLGPVSVPEFNETLTGDNVAARIDFYTHQDLLPDADRKTFLVEAARIIFQKMLDAPATTWKDLATAAADSFDRREVVVWSQDQSVERELLSRQWAGTLPDVGGDFFYNSEFEYAAKNGRGIHRTFDHQVDVHDDGSARVTTSITIENTEPFAPIVNEDTLSYITLYGPAGAVMADGSDRVTAVEPDVHGHPAAGFARSAPPLGSTTLTIVWDVPHLVSLDSGNRATYRLTWLAIAGNSADTLRLRVTLPDGWRWSDAAPPDTIRLDHMVDNSWTISR